MRADRLLRLALLLQARGRMTAAALAAELEVTVRTIYRDMEALSSAGIPVYAEPGPGGGCQLLDGYRTPLTGLTSDEAAAMLVLGVPAPLRDLGLEAPLQGALQQVRAASRLPPTGATVHLDMPRWFHHREDTTHLPTLAASIADRTRVAIVYGTGERARKRREVAPLGIVNKAGVWYLVAQSAKRVNVYRVARIRTLRRLGSTFDRPHDFDLVPFWEAWSADFETTRPHILVIVRASPEAKSSMPEVFGDAVLPTLAAGGPDDPDGWSDVTLSFENEIAAAYRLAGFGGLIEVRFPDSVRTRLVATATETLRRHSPDLDA